MSREPSGADWRAATLAAIIVLALGVYTPAASANLTLNSAVANPARSAKFIARDKVCHPFEELTFFGITPQSTVVEIWPAAAILHDHGRWTGRNIPARLGRFRAFLSQSSQLAEGWFRSRSLRNALSRTETSGVLGLEDHRGQRGDRRGGQFCAEVSQADTVIFFG
jgi:hypothetical protein